MRLRGHHLLCMLTFQGEGYSPAFTANFAAVLRRIGDGEDILIVSGPDDICAPLLGSEGCHCLGASISARDEAAGAALGALLERPLGPGTRLRLSAPMLAQMRQAFAAGTIRAACEGCEWARHCTAIAPGGFRRVRLGAKS